LFNEKAAGGNSPAAFLRLRRIVALRYALLQFGHCTLTVS
jgi:hypothetical protein